MKKTLVYTYGVYDLFHLGHLNLLKQAKTFGDKLIVGVVMDKAVQKQKGINRPIIPTNQRAEIINNCKYVYKTVLQDKFKPIDSIELLRSEGYLINTLVLGEDQKHLSNEDKKYLIKMYKLSIETLPRTFGVSTSDIIQKIKGEK